MLLDAKAAQIPAILTLYKTLQTAKLKAAYKCELLLKQFMPKTAARRKSDTTTKAKSAAKKTAAKSPAKKAAKTKSAAKKTTGSKKK